MAAEAQLAPPRRELTPRASRPPRVVSGRTSMALTVVQPQARYEQAGYTGEALRIFDKVPGWAVAHAMRDNSMAPLIREGEVVVVESSGKPGWLPQEGNLYLIQYASPPAPCEMFGRTTYQVVMPRRSNSGWWAGPLSHSDGRTIFMSDGPYSDECQLAEKLVGRVVGLYNPSALATGGSL